MKLSIYFPDERSRDIERWRDKLNFSQLFLQAFDREIAMRAETTMIGNKTMKAVIDRLKNEFTEAREEGRKDGFGDGVDAAKDVLSKSQMISLVEGTKSVSAAMRECDNYFDAGYIANIDVAAKDFDADGFRQGWEQGFVEGVASVWNEIKHAF